MSKTLSEITSLPDYLTAFGSTLASKAIRSLTPLHTPGKDPLPDFSGYLREPLEAQAHLAAAQVKVFDTYGSGFICGEPGVGKTLTSIVAIDQHAKRSRRNGGSGGNYRAIVICPDHLIPKWVEEIENTIPGATVLAFEKWWEFLLLASIGREQQKMIKDADGHQVVHRVKRWCKPKGAVWIVVGRDQVKRQSGSSALGLARKCFDGRTRRGQSSVTRIVGYEYILNDEGRKVWDQQKGECKQKAKVDKVLICPRCGATPTKKGVPLTPAALGGTKGTKQGTCEAVILEEIGREDGKTHGLDRLVDRETLDDRANTLPHELRNIKPGRVVNHGGKQWRARVCGEPLYQYTRKPYWWPPALLIQRKLRGIAKYLIVDEAHEQKGEDSSQSLAMGKILASTHYCLAMTGTFIGGYAHHLFTLFMRMCPSDMKTRGFDWGDGEGKFSERYGCIDTTYYREVPVDEGNQNRQGLRSRRTSVGEVRVTKKCRPGVMPTLFPQVVMPRTMFLKLDQFVENMPRFTEQVVICQLPGDVQLAYGRLQAQLVSANRALVQGGNRKFLGAMNVTLLSYPDHPWGWEPMFRGNGQEDDTEAVGWWLVPKVYTRKNFHGVATPQNFDPETVVLPKEQELIRLCKTYKEMGDQTWVGCEMTQKRNVMPRLKGLLEREGLKVGILTSEMAKPRDRLEWITRNGPLVDVMMSHPQLVATGVDLLTKAQGGHNFNHIICYQTGYKLFPLKQFSRRGWRLIQWKDCTVDYLTYGGTAQAVAMALMGRKDHAAQKLEEGETSDEGLASMDAQGDGDAALVRALSEHIDPSEIQRNWGRVQGGARKGPGSPAGASSQRTDPGVHPDGEDRTARPPGALPVPGGLYQSLAIPAPGTHSPLSELPEETELAAELMLQAEEEVDEAVAELKLFAGEEESEADMLSRESLAEMLKTIQTTEVSDDEWDF